jgi:DNA-binding NarL/FixJ family response regulator
MNSVLVGDRHQGLGEGIHGLLETTFSAVVKVADAVSLVEGAARLQPEVVIVELALADGDLRGLVAALRGVAPSAKVLLLSAHDQGGVGALALDAGVDGYVLKRLIAGDLLAAIDALLASDRYVSAGVIV